MCQLLYMATADDQPLQESPELRVEPVEPLRAEVCQWFSLPVVRFIGAHTGCSCGFPSVIAEEPIEYFEGMPLGGDDREADLASVRALLALARERLAVEGRFEWYPVADGDEAVPPKGAIDVCLEELSAETFFFNERFLYRVTSSAVRGVEHQR
jgi:hypothetical protein